MVFTDDIRITPVNDILGIDDSVSVVVVSGRNNVYNDIPCYGYSFRRGENHFNAALSRSGIVYYLPTATRCMTLNQSVSAWRRFVSALGSHGEVGWLNHIVSALPVCRRCGRRRVMVVSPRVTDSEDFTVTFMCFCMDSHETHLRLRTPKTSEYIPLFEEALSTYSTRQGTMVCVMMQLMSDAFSRDSSFDPGVVIFRGRRYSSCSAELYSVGVELTPIVACETGSRSTVLWRFVP